MARDNSPRIRKTENPYWIKKYQDWYNHKTTLNKGISVPLRHFLLNSKAKLMTLSDYYKIFGHSEIIQTTITRMQVPKKELNITESQKEIVLFSPKGINYAYFRNNKFGSLPNNQITYKRSKVWEGLE
jgi:hypothetical protein